MPRSVPVPSSEPYKHALHDLELDMSTNMTVTHLKWWPYAKQVFNWACAKMWPPQNTSCMNSALNRAFSFSLFSKNTTWNHSCTRLPAVDCAAFSTDISWQCLSLHLCVYVCVCDFPSLINQYHYGYYLQGKILVLANNTWEFTGFCKMSKIISQLEFLYLREMLVQGKLQLLLLVF